jgi:anti-anti-sigma regulatory factor
MSGTVDLETSYEAQAALAVLAQERQAVLLDLSDAHFVDSRFLQRLIVLDRRRSAMGLRFGIVASDAARSRVFRIKDVERRFAVYRDTQAAAAELEDAPLNENGPELA